ncbi:MAG: hypothetical protein EON58_18330 [Alphaproteobacteria bacterium]|nr:MAG: hypothetical protein EON58_18330 [Alphaproteobacteria bacterium]
MTITRALFDLTPAQIHALMLLDDGPAEDSVGREMEDFQGSELLFVDQLEKLGLVESQAGWRLTLWFKLSPAGRALLRTGLR